MHKRIGLAVHNIHEEYSIELIKGAQKFCKEFGYQLIVFPINAKNSDRHGYEYRHGAVKRLINKANLSGVILSSATLTSFMDINEYIDDIKILEDLPVVHVGLKIPGYSSVTSDSEIAFKKMIRHLIEKHHKKNFLLLSSYDSNIDSALRKSWFMDILNEKQINISDKKILNCDFNKNRAKLRIKEYISNNGKDFDCIVSLNDSMAMGAIQALEDCNIKIPEDTLITGFDNYKGATYSIPTLTTVDPQISLQAYEAGILLDKIINGDKTPVEKEIESKERYRESCGCIGSHDFYKDSIDDDGKEINLTKDDIYNILHNEPSRLNTELYSLHLLTQNSMTVVNMQELSKLLPNYIERISLSALAIFIYDKPKKFNPKAGAFSIPTEAKRIFSYELSGSLKPDTNEVLINPLENMLPENTFNKYYDSIVTYPLFETQHQYGYITVPLGERDFLYYEILLELFSKEITSAIRIDIEEKENLKLEDSNTRLKQYSNILTMLSTTDELTQINNRRGFMNLASKAIKKSVLNGKTGMIIFCDMDGMKQINDTYGHDAGDRAIQAEAEILQRACRTSDIIGRLGGDEFAVYVEGMDITGFRSFRNRIDNETRFINDRNREPFMISMSLGCAQISDETQNINKLLIIADKELYKEKVIKHSLK